MSLFYYLKIQTNDNMISNKVFPNEIYKTNDNICSKCIDKETIK